MNDNSPTIKETIEKHGFYACTPHGYSMWPLLRSTKNPVFIVKPDKRLKKYDVALYIRRDNTHVLHRVLKVCDDSYIMCGDNQWVKETVYDDQVIGVMQSFYTRKGKLVECEKSRKYKIYVRLWCCSLFLRKLALKSFNFVNVKLTNIKKKRAAQKG